MKKASFLFLIFLSLIFLHCGGSGTTIVGNSTTIPTSAEITLSQLSDDTSTATIPLSAFGSSSADVDTTTLTITKNGSTLSGDFDLASHYSTTTRQVTLTLSGLSAGDVLSFVFTLSDESVLTYAGEISSRASTVAQQTGVSLDGDLEVSEDGRYITSSFSQTLVGAYVPTTGSCFRSDESDFEAFYIALDGSDVNIDFLEDQEESHTIFDDVTSTSFTATILDSGYVAECDFSMSSSGITGSCSVSASTSSAFTSGLPSGFLTSVSSSTTCTIEYAKCSGITQSEYYDSTQNEFTWDGSLSTEIDDCYQAN